MNLPPDHIITVTDLVKKFGDFTAVDHISFYVNSGEIFAFLGPNGPESPPQSRCSQRC